MFHRQADNCNRFPEETIIQAFQEEELIFDQNTNQQKMKERNNSIEANVSFSFVTLSKRIYFICHKSPDTKIMFQILYEKQNHMNSPSKYWLFWNLKLIL